MRTQLHPDFGPNGILASRFGVVLPEIMNYLPDGDNDRLALDAQPALITQSNSAIPAWLANFYDPKIIRVLTTPNQAEVILGEAKKGDWTTMTATFLVVESTGEVSSYGDWNTNGNANTNVNFPQRQSYHFQTITQWGEKELAMTGLARIDWASEQNRASAIVLDKFRNQANFFGVAGLQNYGLLNDPNLYPYIAPGPKAYNSNNSGPWITNGVITATANEIYTDIQSLFGQLVTQSNGLIDLRSKLVLALSPGSEVALTTTNSFNVSVRDLLNKNFPNLRIENATQYANTSAGNAMQMICESVEGQETGFCAFTEKMRAHPIILDLSSFRQKKSAGTFGAVITAPYAVAGMIGL